MFFRSISRKHKRLLFFLSRKFFFVHPFVLIFPVCECLGSIARLPAAFREMSLHSCCTPTRVDRKVACVASVSVWFRSKERPTNDEKRDFRFWLDDKWNKSSLPPSSFTRPIFRTVFDSRNLRVSMGWWLLRLSAKILAILRLSVNFFQLRLTKKLKLTSFVSKS